MDEPITQTPIPTGELKDLIAQAGVLYKERFSDEVWFGRCIFVSWYCERATCTFCFRSVTKHKISHANQAKRSLASVVAEAMLIKGLGWRIEFLTGGYGSVEEKDLIRLVKLVSQVLEEKIWVNLGELNNDFLTELKPYVGGIVSSIETVNPLLHNKVCPDKPIQPYVDMMIEAKNLGFALGMTVIIGLGESKNDFPLLQDFIQSNSISRITIYALRPVKETPFTKGPNPLDLSWWIAKTRLAFPDLEIIVGSARYRIPEIRLLLNAGANAVTKLPATAMFNTDDACALEEEFSAANRSFKGLFTSPDIWAVADWDGMLDKLEVTDEERQSIKTTLHSYLKKLFMRGQLDKPRC